MQTLETERLILRPLVAEDITDLVQLYSDARVMQYVTGAPRSASATQQRLTAHLAQHQTYGFGLCAALLKSNQQFIGRCGLEPRVEAGGMAGDIAWMFFPQWWGQGLGQEAGGCLIEHGLAALGLSRVFATADHGNKASIAIMQKLGMRLARHHERGVEYEILRPATTADA